MRRRSPLQLAAADLADDDDDAWDDAWYEKTVLESLDEAVGGRLALMNLDGSALPDEEFVWAGVPGDVRSRVEEVLLLTDACCDKLFDAEYRTACRRFLSRVTVGDPNIFRRKGRRELRRGGGVRVIAKANNAVGAYGSGLTVQELMAFFGESGSSQRAGTFRAAGIDTDPYRGMHLGRPCWCPLAGPRSSRAGTATSTLVVDRAAGHRRLRPARLRRRHPVRRVRAAPVDRAGVVAAGAERAGLAGRAWLLGGHPVRRRAPRQPYA